jgi:hypothetical protein
MAQMDFHNKEAVKTDSDRPGDGANSAAEFNPL